MKRSLLIVFFVFLNLSSPSFALPSFEIEEETEEWRFLDDFSLIPGTASRVHEHYIVGLFYNSGKELFALVYFKVDCDGNRCHVNHRAAYSLFNTGGDQLYTYIDPRDTNLLTNGTPV